MTRDEAIAIAWNYVAANGIAVGSVRTALYFTGEEFGNELEVQPGPSWAVYFWYGEPPANPIERDMSNNLCIEVDVTTRAASLISWL